MPFFAIPALAAFGMKAAGAVSAVQSAAGAVQGLQGSGKPNRTDRNRRVPETARNLEQALAGSLPAAQWILQQRFGSATQYGRSLAAQAWQQVEQQRPALAAEALKTKVEVVTQGNPSARDQLGDELERLWARLRVETANTVQRVAAGAGAGAAESVAGDQPGARYNVPVSRDQLMYIGLALVLGMLAIWFFTRRK